MISLLYPHNGDRRPMHKTTHRTHPSGPVSFVLLKFRATKHCGKHGQIVRFEMGAQYEPTNDKNFQRSSQERSLRIESAQS